MAGRVNPQFPFPVPGGTDPHTLWRGFVNWAGNLVTQLQTYGARLNHCLPEDGSEPMTGPISLAQYPTASLPPASAHTGALVYDSTAGTVKYSNGSSWVAV